MCLLSFCAIVDITSFFTRLIVFLFFCQKKHLICLQPKKTPIRRCSEKKGCAVFQPTKNTVLFLLPQLCTHHRNSILKHLHHHHHHHPHIHSNSYLPITLEFPFINQKRRSIAMTTATKHLTHNSGVIHPTPSHRP